MRKSISNKGNHALGDFELSQIWYKTGSGTTISKFDYTYDALRRIKTWTMQADNGTPQVLSPEYDTEDQLLGATLSQNDVPTKAYGYGYDDAGNRTGEQIETFTPTRALTITPSGYNNVNQLLPRTAPTNVPVRFRGTINEPGTVKIDNGTVTVSAKMTQDPASATKGKIFTATVDLGVGNKTVSVVATDLSTRQTPPPPGPNTKTNRYSVTVAGCSSKSFGYDLNGNCTSAGSTTYGWDGEDRLIAITNGALTTEISYDGFGRRVSIVERNNGTVTSTKRFVWCGMDLAEELDGNNVVTKQYFPEGQGIGPLSYYYTRDHLGSVREVFEYSGVVHARYDYDPYGRRGANQITSNPVEADFGFTGHYLHAPSGLHLALFRAYDADTGRWLSRDPIEEDGGLNLYGYVGNNPMNYSDPDGLFFREFGESLGRRLYNLMMGDRGGADFNQNTMLYQRSAELGGGDNVLPDVMSDAAGTAVDIGTDAAASYFGGKLLGAAAGGVCKLAKRGHNLHHAWPMYLGGPVKQDLEKLPRWLHKRYHKGLDKVLPRNATAEYYRGLPPEQQAENFKIFLEYTESFDKKYGTHLIETIEKVATGVP